MKKTLVINLDRCIGCHSCEVACKLENNIPLGSYWSKVVQVGPMGDYPDIHTYWLPVQCQQCEDSPCTHVCPTGASYRDEDGVVLIDKAKCIGCKYCMMACPYGVRSWNAGEKVVEKCTLCAHRTSNGNLPRCVEACCADARFYGDLDDSSSDAAKALSEANEEQIHRLADVGNGPTVAYVLSEKVSPWVESSQLKQVTPE